MKIIDIRTSKPYQAMIGSGAAAQISREIRKLCPRTEKLALVSDDTVFPLHGEAILEDLRSSGFETHVFTIPHGEQSKTAGSLLSLLRFLAERHFTRTDALIALGGGMIGDLTGFAAAVYMRGIPYFQVPTTFLAAIDSSVGGKTAVDLPEGKNLIGAFWQPKAVFCDIDLLDTLPPSVFSDGCAEAIKTAVLFDHELFQYFSLGSIDREFVISRCIEHKRDVVINDEFDQGLRSLLNFGHTLGHAVESCSGYSLSHGKSVAIGMAVVSRAAAGAGLCDVSLPGQLCEVLKKYSLPVETDILLDQLMEVILSDKKRSGSMISLIVPRQIGRCEMIPMDDDQLKKFMETGLRS